MRVPGFTGPHHYDKCRSAEGMKWVGGGEGCVGMWVGVVGVDGEGKELAVVVLWGEC